MFDNNSYLQVWALCTADRPWVWFKPCCRSDTCIADQGLGQGPNVVLELIQKASLSARSELFLHNLITSSPLLSRILDMEIAGTGTVGQDKLHRVPNASKKDVKKKSTARGTTDVLC